MLRRGPGTRTPCSLSTLPRAAGVASAGPPRGKRSPQPRRRRRAPGPGIGARDRKAYVVSALYSVLGEAGPRRCTARGVPGPRNLVACRSGERTGTG